MSSHHVEQLDARTWKIVEDDPYGQYPFMYVIRGKDKLVVIDTGCGVGDIRTVVDSLNQPPLPCIVVCTHVHFDVRGVCAGHCVWTWPAHVPIVRGAAAQHVGGCKWFTESAARPARDILMSDAAQAFSKNYELTSLGAGVGCTVGVRCTIDSLAISQAYARLLALSSAAPTRRSTSRTGYRTGFACTSTTRTRPCLTRWRWSTRLVTRRTQCASWTTAGAGSTLAT